MGGPSGTSETQGRGFGLGSSEVERRPRGIMHLATEEA